MDHFVNIRFKPDLEFPDRVLLEAFFAKFHRAMVTIRPGKVGISFPRYTERSLGNQLRIHGDSQALSRLMDQSWHKNMRDYVEISPIQGIPSDCKYRIVKRVQAKTSNERFSRRIAKKGILSFEQAQEKMSDRIVPTLNLPFIRMRSSSTSQTFPLFIFQGDLQDQPQAGEFSTYGLSTTGTIPWF